MAVGLLDDILEESSIWLGRISCRSEEVSILNQ